MNRLTAETILARRVGALLSAVGLDASVSDVPNDTFAEPLGRALTAVGITPASLLTVTDADLAALSSSRDREFIDRAEIEALTLIELAAAALVDIEIGERREDLAALAVRVEKLLARRTAEFTARYPSSTATAPELTAGTLTLDFIEPTPTGEEEESL